MLAIKIWNYFKGYVIISVEGLTLERLLNLAATNNIYLWDVKRHNNIMIEMKTTLLGFKELKSIVKKVGCKIEINQKKGFPFFCERLKQRKMLTMGFILFCIITFLLTSTILKIEVIGNEQTPKEEIITFLENSNVKVGKYKYKIDKDEIKGKLLNEFNYFSFVSLKIKGTVLTIEIREQDLSPEKVDRSIPCNLVAKQKGIIVKIITKNGKDLVKKGDVVEEGKLLITGVIDNEINEDIMLVHAEGEVLALTRYSSVVKSYIINQEEKFTGKIYKQKGLKIKDKGLKFLKGEIPFENYKEEVVEKDLFNFKNYDIEFPIKIINYEYREFELKEVKQNLDFLKKAAQINAIKEINKTLPKECEIQSKDVIHQINDNTLTTKVVVEVIENIGKIQLIEN